MSSTINLLDDDDSSSDLLSPAVPNCVFVPSLPENCPSFAPHVLLHLKVGLLNVAYSSNSNNSGSSSSGGGGQQSAGGMWQPPMHQPLTLPLSLHLHPDLLTPSQRLGGGVGGGGVPSASPSALSSSSSFIPPSLLSLQRSILPSLLSHFPAMISSIKLKKMDTLRGNRVGLIRTKETVFAFTFRETNPSYHVLTVSAKRVRRKEKEDRAREEARRANFNSKAASSSNAAAASSSSAPLPGASLSSSLSSFPLFPSPCTPVSLSSLSSLRGASNSNTPDEGFYTGQGFASFLVSKHALHVRMIPTRKWKERMEKEREAERERRAKAAQRDRLDSVLREEDEQLAEDEAETDARQHAGSKRKKTTAAAGSGAASAATKKARRAEGAAALSAAVPVPPAPADDDEADSPAASGGADEDPYDEWLNLNI